MSAYQKGPLYVLGIYNLYRRVFFVGWEEFARIKCPCFQRADKLVSSGSGHLCFRSKVQKMASLKSDEGHLFSLLWERLRCWAS